MAEPTQHPTPPTPPDVRLLRSITLRNILSFNFGSDTQRQLELRALNVLIGPNGSGKSNFLNAIELLKRAPDSENLKAELKADHWLHKGNPKPQTARIIADVHLADFNIDIVHRIEFDESFAQLNEWFITELIASKISQNAQELKFEFDSDRKNTIVNFRDEVVELSSNQFNHLSSCLFQLRDRRSYPLLTELGSQYRSIRLYREWTFGQNSTPRLPRRTDERNDFLAEDGSNLGLVLNKLRTYPEVKDQFISALNELYEGIRDFDVLVEGGSVQIFLTEGNTSIPATRLSDGTLRYLCLLAILLHPTPPPLICLEEPELGLHPDAVVAVGKLIKEASTRTQLIITTHSQILVDTFQESPEDVVVVSKKDGATHFNRLDAEKLRPYLETYSLGSLWNSGDIGGNRW